MMSLPYFFIEEFDDADSIILPEETSKHCISVLRMHPGERLQLTDGKGNLVTGRVKQANKKHCFVTIEEKKLEQPHSKKISVAISLLKNISRFEWFLEKATEIGVSEVIPLICERTERHQFRFERMNNILISAMLQSEQAWLPVLREPQPFEKIIASSLYRQKLIAHCSDNKEKKDVTAISIETGTQIFIGPEGDFTNKEIEQASANDYTEVSLGKTRLRSETAGLVAVTLLMNRERE